MDGNVLRVYSRLFGIRESILLPDVRKKLEMIASSMVSQARPGDYNQAVMDLGATVCVPGTPDCSSCPLALFCDAFSRGDAADLPVIPGKAPPKSIRWTVPVLLSGNRTLVRCRTESLLQGLWCFPMLECEVSETPAVLEKDFCLPVVSAGTVRHARHVFTHLIWEMDLLPLKTETGIPAPADYRWVSPDELEKLVFPSAMNAALKTARELADFHSSSLTE